MMRIWMKRAMAALLTAALLVSCALAEDVEVAVTAVDAVEDAVYEAGLFDLTGDAPDETPTTAPTLEPDETPEEIVEETAEIPSEDSLDAITEEPTEEPEEETAEGSGEEPAEKTDEESAEEPAEGTTEESGEEPEERTTEESGEEPVEEIDEESGEEPAEKNDEESAEEPAEETKEEIDEESAEKPVEETDEESAEEPVEEIGEVPAEEIAEEPTEENAEETAEESEEENAEEPAEENAEENAEEAQEEPEDAPVGEPEATPEAEPTATPEAEPTATPEAEPTATPMTTPTATPTVEPTATPVAAEISAPKAEAAPSLILSAGTLNVGLNESAALSVVSLPEGASAASFESSDPGIASVDAAGGTVVGHALGSAIVTVTAGEAQATCVVNVLMAPGKLSLSQKALTLGVGQVAALSGVLPEGTASQITWKTSNASVATVDADGNVTARKKGKATITGKTFNGKQATCELTVVPAPTSMSARLDSYVLSVGMRKTITVKLNKGSEAGFAVTSSDPGVVSAEGLTLTAVGAGAASVTVSTHNGLSRTLNLSVLSAPSVMTLPESGISMGKGEKRTLTPTYDIDTVAGLTWSSSKPKVVTVTKAGKLVAKKQGRAVLTVTTHNGLTASCPVRVYKAPSKVTITAGKKLTMGVGETYGLTAKLPSGTGSGLTWSSTAPRVATVDADGNVTALAQGTAKIKVKTFNGKQAVCKVTVLGAPTSVGFQVGDQTLGVGMKVDLKPVVNRGAGANIWVASDNPGVASVKGGVVTAVSPGTATITASIYNGLSASVTVTVLSAPGAISVPQSTLYMGIGEKVTLSPTTAEGTYTTFTFKSADKKIATVSAAGVVKAKKKGSTSITITSHNGKKAKVKIKVYKAPGKVTLSPSSLAMEVGGTQKLTISLPKGTASTVTFASSAPDVVGVDTSGTVYALQAGSAIVTATTYNNKQAYCNVTVAGTAQTDDDAGSSGTLSLSSSGTVMMRVGASWTLTASTSGSADGITWSTTSDGIARISDSGGTCTVTGAGAGTAIVSAKLADGTSASVIFMVVDVTDLSASNFNTVQKVLLNHEELINSEAGGNVIWDMISSKLLKSNYTQDQVTTLIDKLKSADSSYRNLYIYSFGTYSSVAEVSSLSTSYYDQNSNTLYLKNSSQYSGSDYAYVVFHETGHAIDWNADANSALNSLNSEATSAVLTDVKNLLTTRVATAISECGLSASDVRSDKVVDALMDYRTLQNYDTVKSELGLTAAEEQVYAKLSNSLSGEMNATLPTNNGCMVWDAVEGATNYAVHGKFGHYYLLADGSPYKAEATYYFWNLKGEPQITTEPWAEFFSANVMGDTTTLTLNWTYLPETCKYFTETFVPKLLEYFTNRIKNQ